MTTRLATILLGLMLTTVFPSGCSTSHKVESTHEIKPMHLTIDINLKIQRDLNEKFAKRDEIERNISKDEAERALDQYLAKKKD